MERLAFVGSQGTGKTTLSRELAKKLQAEGKKVSLVNEAARSCPFPLNKKTDFKSQFYIISNQITQENLASSNKPDYLISDRCVVDALVYWESAKRRKEFAKEHDKIMKNVCDNWMKSTQTTLVYVKTNENDWKKRMQEDGFRETDVNWFKEIQELFDKKMRSKKIRCIQVENNKPEDIERITENLKQKILGGTR